MASNTCLAWGMVKRSGSSPTAMFDHQSLPRNRPTAPTTMRAWSNPNGGSASTGSHLALDSSARSTAASMSARYATVGIQPRGSRSGSPYVSSCSRYTAPTPVFSVSLRWAVSSGRSLGLMKPPGRTHVPAKGSSPRWTSRTCSRPDRGARTTGTAYIPAGAGNPEELTAVMAAARPARWRGGIAMDCGDALGCVAMDSGNITTAEGFRKAYAEVFADVDAMAEDLDDDRELVSTGCPGWTVRDAVAHIVDLESLLIGRQRPDHAIPENLPHIRNEARRFMEIGVDARRGVPLHELLAEYQDVTTQRLSRLEDLTDSQLDEMGPGFFRPSKVRSFLAIRVFDLWSHAQDLRRALA